MTLGLSPVAIGAMGANIVLKGVVGLFYFKVENSQVQALVQGKCAASEIPQLLWAL